MYFVCVSFTSLYSTFCARGHTVVGITKRCKLVAFQGSRCQAALLRPTSKRVGLVILLGLFGLGDIPIP